MVDETKTNVAMSHKGKIILSYNLIYKLEAIACVERNSNSSASEKFNVDKKRIRQWRKSKDKFPSLRKKDHGAKRKRLDGARRKPLLIIKWKKYLSNGFTADVKKDYEFVENL